MEGTSARVDYVDRLDLPSSNNDFATLQLKFVDKYDMHMFRSSLTYAACWHLTCPGLATTPGQFVRLQELYLVKVHPGTGYPRAKARRVGIDSCT